MLTFVNLSGGDAYDGYIIPKILGHNAASTNRTVFTQRQILQNLTPVPMSAHAPTCTLPEILHPGMTMVKLPSFTSWPIVERRLMMANSPMTMPVVRIHPAVMI